MRIAVLTIVSCLMALPAMAQAPVATAARVTLRAVVVDANNGALLPRARVVVMSGPTGIASLFSDDRGQFAVGIDTNEEIAIRTTKAGFAATSVRLTPSRVRPADAPMRIEMARGAVISGRVVDVRGEPTTPTLPMALVRTGVGAAVADQVAIAPDDRGDYRVGGLAAGRYAIGPLGAPGLADLNSDRVMASPLGPVHARVVDVQAGREVTGIDFVLDTAAIEPPIVPRATDGDGSIRGRVLTISGQPIAGARVTIGRRMGNAWSPVRTGPTDHEGRFSIGRLPAGSFTVEASKTGYVRSQYGERATGLPEQSVVLAERQVVDNVDVVMSRASAISGIVVDEYGEPLQDAGVHVLRVTTRSQPGDVAIRQQGTFARRTDDRGHFRLPGIAPGTYILTATLPAETVDAVDGPRLAYAPSYYPGTPDFASATPIEIVSEQDVPALTVMLQRIPVARISGVAVNSKGLPFTGTVRLTPRPLGNISLEARQVHPERDGSFAFTDVPPGNYLVQALGTRMGTEFAVDRVIVGDRDPVPLLIRTAPGASVSGRIMLEGATGGEQLWGYSVNTVPVDGAPSGSYQARVSSPIASGTEFNVMGSLAGSMRLRFSSPDEAWYLKSVMINGVDAADEPYDFGFDGRAYTDVDVVFSRSGAAIAGRAADDRAVPVRDYAVVVFATDRAKWFGGSRWVRLVRSAADGAFRVSALPPGEYWVAAIDRLDSSSTTAGEWHDRELLEALSSRALRITVAQAQSQVLNLRLLKR